MPEISSSIANAYLSTNQVPASAVAAGNASNVSSGQGPYAPSSIGGASSAGAAYQEYGQQFQPRAPLHMMMRMLMEAMGTLGNLWGSLAGQEPLGSQPHGGLPYEAPTAYDPSLEVSPIPVSSSDSTNTQAVKSSYNALLSGIQNLPMGESSVQPTDLPPGEQMNAGVQDVQYDKYLDANGDTVVTSTPIINPNEGQDYTNTVGVSVSCRPV